jgi:ubiquinone biosynthesis protein COQ4
VAGEVALKWLEMSHTGLPMATLSSLVGPLRLSSAERGALQKYLVPWAVRTGHTCTCLLSVPYEQMWDRDLEEMRAQLKFPAAPAHVLGWADKGLI